MASLYPIALSLMVQNHLDEASAWGAAILRERKLCGQGACSAASQVIVRALAWSFSTSDVERVFHDCIN